jgi:hypothetical protein
VRSQAKASGMLVFSLLACLLLASSAQAATGYQGAGSFAEGGFAKPSRIAVDAASGDVLVIDTGNDRVQVFDSGGSAATLLASFGAGELSAPYGIAIDQSDGDVYISDAGNNRIARYATDGAATPTYTLDGTYSSPPSGSGAGEIGSFASPIAVDPTVGDLLVADRGNLRVSRFDSSGAFVNAFNGEGSAAGPFTSLLDIAVDDAGNPYVVANGSVDEAFAYVFGSRVEGFNPDGSPRGELGAGTLGEARAIAFDGKSGNVLVATGGGAFGLGGPLTLRPFHEGAPVESTAYAVAETAPLGLAVDDAHAGRVYGLVGVTESIFGVSGISVQVFDPVAIPEVEIAPVDAIGTTTAHLSGSVNPGGAAETKYHFEYSSDGGVNWAQTPEVEAGTGTAPEAVSADLTGLAPNSSYLVRLLAANPSRSRTSPIESFQTLRAAPAATTGPASSLTASSAQLNVSIDAFGITTTYHIDFGTGTAYGRQIPAVDVAAGSGVASKSFSQPVSGLAPGTTYHYRVVAKNEVGTTTGADRTFTTPAQGPVSRAYEMVSPVDKDGSNVRPLASHRAAPGGNSVVFTTKTPIGSRSEAGSLQPKYFARRSATGWSLSPLDPPQLAPAEFAQMIRSTLAVSEDESTALVMTNKALTPDGVDGAGNLYLRDIATGAYELVASSAASGNGNTFYAALTGLSEEGEHGLLTATDDFSAFAFASNVSLVPGTTGPYIWSEGELSSAPATAGFLPDGTPVGVEVQRIAFAGSPVSPRILFTTPSAPGLYLREGDHTVAVSESHAGAEAGEVQEGSFVGASKDGSVVYFTSAAELVEGAPSGANSLYSFEADTGELSYVMGEFGPLRRLSTDGEYIYFSSLSESNLLKVWHAGQTHVVGDISVTFGNPTSMWTSPSGRYALFATWGTLTEYDNNGPACPGQTYYGTPAGSCIELYRYDANEDELVCASCRTDGRLPTANATSSEEGSGAFNYVERSVLDNGRVFFDTTEQLVREDVNGTSDAYMYDDGRPQLISGGRPGFISQFAESDASGENVFFTTDQPLVSQDTDRLIDLYDARVGGGIASQNPTSGAPAGCEGACGGGAPPPAAIAPSSMELAGAGDRNQRQGRKRAKACAKHRGVRPRKCGKGGRGKSDKRSSKNRGAK